MMSPMVDVVRRAAGVLGVSLLIGSASLACEGGSQPVHPPPSEGSIAAEDGRGQSAAGGQARDEGQARALAPVVLITDPEVLAALEAAGLSAGAVAFGQGGAEISSFVDSERLTSLRAILADDVAEFARADSKAGVGLDHAHRLFDIDWLDAAADKTRFELIALVNRADRQPFAAEHCGETRLIYRLAYTTELDGERVDSRLPMTLNVVLWQDGEGDDCGALAQRWMAPVEQDASERAAWLRRPEGPLAPTRLSPRALEAVEVNLQVVRWPAVMHPSLGGHAEYVLRVFRPDSREGGGLAPAPLENTPDVARLAKDPDERAALLAWLRDGQTLAALADGVPVMPERFAATRAVSVAPRALARLANRPFSQLFDADDFADLELAGHATVETPRGLLRRLDTLSCHGCHETRSVAGFHLLGEPRDGAKVLDTMFVPTSPHLDGDLDRRLAWIETLADGTEPDPFRPLSDHERHRGNYGSHCGLGDPAFAAWTCAAELECVALDDPDMGVCLTPARSAGDPCEFGQLRTQRQGHRDRIRDVELGHCEGGATCNQTKVGFPGGMCTKSCASLGPDEACGAIVNLRQFNDCLARRQPFPGCIEAAAFSAGMRRCDADHRCRDDYICARSPMEPDAGVCIPPYFLFQMRVDGHVL